MKLILKFRAGISSLNETEPLYDAAFKKSISKLIDKKSDLHQYVDDELSDIAFLNSKVRLLFDKDANRIFSEVTYNLDREPTQEELRLIIEETSGQLTDGYGEEPWSVKTANGIVQIDLINYRKSEYLNPVEVNLLQPKKNSKILFLWSRIL